MLPTAIPDNHFASLSSLEQGYWWYLARVAWAKRLVSPWYDAQKKRPEVYADLGCGTGGFARALNEEFPFPKVYLVDSDPNALKRIEFPQATIVESDLGPKLTLPKAPALISLMDVIEHVENDKALIARAAQMLAPGGMLLLTVPAHQALYSPWDKKLGHHRRYSRSQILDTVSQSGLRVKELRSMWSFLILPAYLRKFGREENEKLEFPVVPDFVNSTLLQLSHLEFGLPSWARLPFGTSWILSAEKT